MENLDQIKLISEETTVAEILYLRNTFFPTFPIDVLYKNSEEINVLLFELMKHYLTKK